MQRSIARLATDTETIAQDLRIVAFVARQLDRRLPGDSELDPILATAVNTLAAEAQTGVDSLSGVEGRMSYTAAQATVPSHQPSAVRSKRAPEPGMGAATARTAR